METKIINFVGQKWIYERGNYQIVFQNAYSLQRQGQERVTVNGVMFMTA